MLVYNPRIVSEFAHAPVLTPYSLSTISDFDLVSEKPSDKWQRLASKQRSTDRTVHNNVFMAAAVDLWL